MTLADLPSFAANCSAQATSLTSGRQTLPDVALYDYFTNVRACVHHWRKTLAVVSESAKPTTELIDLLHRILVMESVVRVWGTALAEYGRCSGRYSSHSIARRSVEDHVALASQLVRRIRERSDEWSDVDDIETRIRSLDQVQRLVHRWTDLLIGQISVPDGEVHFAFDADRASEFRQTRSPHEYESSGGVLWTLIAAGIQGAFQNTVLTELRLSDHELQLVCSILASFPTRVDDQAGPSTLLRMPEFLRHAAWN